MIEAVYCAVVLSEQRHHAIVTAVRERGTVSVAALSAALDVSAATIRRDLDVLAQRGLVRRVRGGAADPRRAIRPDPEASPDADAPDPGAAARRRIAARAATLIDDGDVVVLDIGATVAALCPYLIDRSITVITASLTVLTALADAPRINLVALGGHVSAATHATTGHLTVAALRQLRADIAFLGCAGLHADGSILDSSPSEVPIKQAILDIAERSYLLASAQKMPGSGTYGVAGIDRVTALVTDQMPDGFDLTGRDGRAPEILLACD